MPTLGNLGGGGAPVRTLGNLGSIVQRQADRTGLDADYLNRVIRIESGGNPNSRTGSYRGLFQLSPSEFSRYGGSGSIYDPEQNTIAATNKIAAERGAFETRYGRPATATDLYMTHQQGPGGYAAHLDNPNAPAWQNMYMTAEGQQRGPAWARQAIWGNIPDDLKPRFGNVNNVTSQDLIDIYKAKLGEGEGPSGWQMTVGPGGASPDAVGYINPARMNVGASGATTRAADLLREEAPRSWGDILADVAANLQMRRAPQIAPVPMPQLGGATAGPRWTPLGRGVTSFAQP